MIAVVAVGVGYAVLLVVVTASLPLGGIPLAMAVVDEGSNIAAVETGTKIWLVDLLVHGAHGRRAYETAATPHPRFGGHAVPRDRASRAILVNRLTG